MYIEKGKGVVQIYVEKCKRRFRHDKVVGDWYKSLKITIHFFFFFFSDFLYDFWNTNNLWKYDSNEEILHLVTESNF